MTRRMARRRGGLWRKKLSDPWRVLGRFEPSVYEAGAVRAGFKQAMHEFELDVVGIVEVREPLQNTTLYESNRPPDTPNEVMTDGTYSTRVWHYDNHRKFPLLYMWASSEPTELCVDPDGFIFVPEPFEIVEVNNLEAYHRMPAYVGKDRWYIRYIGKGEAVAV